MHGRALGVRDLGEFPSSPKARLSFITDTLGAETLLRTLKPEEPDIRAVATMADVPISMRLNVSRLIGLGSCSRPTTQMCSRTLELRRTPLRSAP